MHWVKKLASLKTKAIVFSESNPPSPWNPLQALRLGGLKIDKVISHQDKNHTGPQYDIVATLEECVGSDDIISAIAKIWPKYQFQTVYENGESVITGPPTDDEFLAAMKVMNRAGMCFKTLTLEGNKLIEITADMLPTSKHYINVIASFMAGSK